MYLVSILTHGDHPEYANCEKLLLTVMQVLQKHSADS
jgi:hypothetical protein